MTTSQTDTALVQALHTTERRLGHWTETNRIEVRAVGSRVTLDLRSMMIPAGDIELWLHGDHSALTLHVADDAFVDTWDLRQEGRCSVKDSPTEALQDGRRIVVRGLLRRGELRVRRGGVATIHAMLTREYVHDLVRCVREGTALTIDDPSRDCPGTRRPPRR